MDADYADNERDPAQPHFEHALFVKTRVMSRGARTRSCDAGHKCHAIDSGLPRVLAARRTHWNMPTAATSTASCGRAGASAADLPALGEMVWLVPGHCDPTVNLHDRYVGVRGGLRRRQGRGASDQGRRQRRTDLSAARDATRM